jgi:hypothetical protein
MQRLPVGFSLDGRQAAKEIGLTKQLQDTLVTHRAMKRHAIGQAQVAWKLLDLRKSRTVADHIEAETRKFAGEERQSAENDPDSREFDLLPHHDEAGVAPRHGTARDAARRQLAFGHDCAQDPADRRVPARGWLPGAASCKHDISSAGNPLQERALQPPE